MNSVRIQKLTSTGTPFASHHFNEMNYADLGVKAEIYPNALHNKEFHFPGGSVSKESTCNAGDLGLIPWVGKIPWSSNPLQYSGLGNSMDRRT